MEQLGEFINLLEFDMFIKHVRYFPDGEPGHKFRTLDKIRVMVLLPL